jgi:hypothetical protein
MKSDDRIMHKLHQIRESHYEKTKELSLQEQLAFDVEKVDEIKRKYRLNLPKMQIASTR